MGGQFAYASVFRVFLMGRSDSGGKNFLIDFLEDTWPPASDLEVEEEGWSLSIWYVDST